MVEQGRRQEFKTMSAQGLSWEFQSVDSKKFTLHEFDDISLYFKAMDPYFSQNPWVSFYIFQKSVGTVEPTEPAQTMPLVFKTPTLPTDRGLLTIMQDPINVRALNCKIFPTHIMFLV